MMANMVSRRALPSFFRAFLLPLAAASTLFVVSPVEGALTHEWLFNDGTANDSMGAAHGVLNGAATVAGGQLSLPNTATTGNSTVDLNASVIGINSYSAFSIEAWATPSSVMTGFTTLLGFGMVNTTDANFAANYFILQTHRGDNVSRAAIAISNDATPFSEEDFANGPELNDNLQHHYVATVTNSAINLYVDGTLRGTGVVETPNTISGIATQFARIGSAYPVDPLYAGTVNELSIHDEALTAQQAMDEFIAGPKGPLLPQVRVNRDTGVIDFISEQAPVSVVVYSLTSANGSLNSAAWLPIADNYDFSSGGEFDGDDNWTKLSAAGSKTNFSEAEFEGGNGGLWGLGTGAMTSIQLGGSGAWRKSIYEDLQIEVRLDDGTDYPVSIQYTGNGGQPFRRSDLNFDNSINIADWNLFLAKLGTVFTNMSVAEAYSMGDLNGDLRNDRVDFRLFKTDYNAVNGSGAFEAMLASVPEPSTLAMMLLVCAGALITSRSRLSNVAVDRRSTSRTTCCSRATSLWTLPASAVLVVALFGHADAAIKHRYGFNEGATGDASNRPILDSVGSRNGQVLGAGSSATASELILNGGPSATAAYVDLPDEIISDLTDASFEAWYTLSSAQSWGRVFDFGSTDAAANMGELDGPGGGGNGQDFIFYSPVRGTNLSEQRVGFGNQDLLFGGAQAGNAGAGVYSDLDPEFTHVLNQQYHAVVVVDADGAGVGQATVALYINGAIAPQAAGQNQANPFPVAHQLGNLNDVNNWLGRSNWTADANFGGSFNEFRIYDHAMSESQVTNSFLLGPDATPGSTVVSLEVNKSNGQVKLISNFNQPLQIDYYELTSIAGALNPAGWTGIDGTTTPGEGWDKSGASGVNQLIEAYLPEAGFTFPAMGQLPIGTAYDTTVFGAEDGDVQFGLVLNSGAFLSGNVTYVTSTTIPGDFSNDGKVDAADYVVWRKTINTPAGYNLWRTNFGRTSGSGTASAAAVPEPAGLSTIWCGAFVFCAWMTRKRREGGNPMIAGVKKFAGSWFAVVALAMTLAGRAEAATPDRIYRFGDDPNETGPAAPGLHPVSAFGPRTLDGRSTAANGSDAQDLNHNSGPIYFDAGGSAPPRPGASVGQLGLQFDGNDTLFLTNGGLGSPSIGDEGYTETGAPGYTNITTRYIDGWVRPTGGAGTRRDILNDTAQFGIFINASNNWGFIQGTTTVNSTTPAALNQWTHVYSRTFTNTAAVLYIDGVAVAITEDNYNTTAATGNLVFGASLDQLTNFFSGQLDDFTIGVSGDNTGQTGGQNWGPINLAAENDFIRQALLGKSQADVNLDGVFNQTDINTFVANWLVTKTLGPANRAVADLNTRKAGDLNFNGQVEIDDAWILHNAIPPGSGVSLDFSLLGAGVPEPSSLILYTLGLLGLASRRLRRCGYSNGG
jgi:hypothetical protein